MDAAPKPLILIIDDREDLLRFCERSLGAKYEFHHVTGGRAAGAVLRDQPVAGVLLDRDFSQVHRRTRAMKDSTCCAGCGVSIRGCRC
jgi:DNA-binding NtrC family response regulator